MAPSHRIVVLHSLQSLICLVMDVVTPSTRASLRSRQRFYWEWLLCHWKSSHILSPLPSAAGLWRPFCHLVLFRARIGDAWLIIASCSGWVMIGTRPRLLRLSFVCRDLWNISWMSARIWIQLGWNGCCHLVHEKLQSSVVRFASKDRR